MILSIFDFAHTNTYSLIEPHEYKKNSLNEPGKMQLLHTRNGRNHGINANSFARKVRRSCELIDNFLEGRAKQDLALQKAVLTIQENLKEHDSQLNRMRDEQSKLDLKKIVGKRARLEFEIQKKKIDIQIFKKIQEIQFLNSYLQKLRKKGITFVI